LALAVSFKGLNRSLTKDVDNVRPSRPIYRMLRKLSSRPCDFPNVFNNTLFRRRVPGRIAQLRLYDCCGQWR
jgi:hypothetical protein